MTSSSELDRDMFRHIVASLAYRAMKTIRDTPDAFADFRTDAKSRTPAEILTHMGDLFDWALSMLQARKFGTILILRIGIAKLPASVILCRSSIYT